MATINNPAEANVIYKINSNLLMAQADEIRTLNGTADIMTPIDMTTALQSANAEVAEQEALLVEIANTLQNKAMGGGGSGGSGVETCTVTITKPSAWGLHYIDYTGLVDGVITPASQNFSGTITSISVEVVAGSMLTITNAAPSSQEYYANTVCTNCELIRLTTDDLSLMSVAMMIGLPTSGTATIAING